MLGRVLSLLHKIFSFATADTMNEWCVAQNPAAGLRRFHEEKRERWLSEDELQRLAVALHEYPHHCAEAEVSDKQRKFLRNEAQRAMNALRLSCQAGLCDVVAVRSHCFAGTPQPTRGRSHARQPSRGAGADGLTHSCQAKRTCNPPSEPAESVSGHGGPAFRARCKYEH